MAIAINNFLMTIKFKKTKKMRLAMPSHQHRHSRHYFATTKLTSLLGTTITFLISFPSI